MSRLRIAVLASGTGTNLQAILDRAHGRDGVQVVGVGSDRPDARALERAREAGAVVEGDVQVRPWGRMANLADPFGHGFCLLEFRGRGYDEVLDPAPPPPAARPGGKLT